MSESNVVGVRFEPEALKRLKAAAAADMRTVANVVELCTTKYLPTLEAEIKARSLVLKEPPGTYRTARRRRKK